MKYDTQLHLDYKNTMSLIINEVESNSTILEFGPASGRLTKYLKEEKNCKMYFVEIDEQAGKIASEFAQDYLIGDIEQYEWFERFKNTKFDYIIFADVLEHLRNADLVLEKSKILLNEDGFILFSIPNICHNSIIIDLINDKFEYKNTGLLDDTHLKFWTENSLDKLVKNSGLYTVKKFATYTQVGKNEFDNNYSDIIYPFLLKSRNIGELYQYVYKISKKKSEYTDFIKRRQDYYYMQYFYLIDDDYEDEHSEKIYLDFSSDTQVFEISVPQNCKNIRFDPLNCMCSIEILEIEGYIKQNKVNIELDELKIGENSIYFENCCLFNTDDSQIIIDNKKNFNKIKIKLKYFDIEKLNPLVDKVVKNFKSYSDIIEQKENYINEQRDTISQRDDEIRYINGIVEQKENYINEQRKIISELNNFVEKPIVRNLYKLYKLCKSHLEKEKNRNE